MSGRTSPEVVVLDYGSGNVRSVARALERLGARVEVSAEPRDVTTADGLVVPGVGAFASVMQGLQRVDGPALIAQRLAAGRSVLGICVGLQVMFAEGLEHGVRTPGLGHWRGVVHRLDAPVVPHMGWSAVRAPAGSVLLTGLADQRFYFVHSYAARSAPEAARVTWTRYGTAEQHTRFVAAAEDGVLSATQFHPEKSGEAGATLLQNWLTTLG